MFRTPVLCIVVAASAAGCAGYAGDMSAASRVQSREVFGDIERLQYGKQVQVQLPARAAVFLTAHESAWTPLLLDSLEKDPGTWSAVDSLHVFDEDASRGSRHFESLRAAASRQRADLLVVAEMSVEDRDEHNALSILNLLVLPCFFLPTQEHEVGVRTRAAVVDVRNGLVYATADDHQREEFTATAAGEDGRVRDAARRMAATAVEALRPKLERKLRALDQGTR